MNQQFISMHLILVARMFWRCFTFFATKYKNSASLKTNIGFIRGQIYIEMLDYLSVYHKNSPINQSINQINIDWFFIAWLITAVSAPQLTLDHTVSRAKLLINRITCSTAPYGHRKCLWRHQTGSSSMDSYLRFQHGSSPRHDGLAFPPAGGGGGPGLPPPAAVSALTAALSPFGGFHRAMAAAGAPFPPTPTPPPPHAVGLPGLPTASQLMTSPFGQSPMSALTLAERLAGMKRGVAR